MASFPPIAAISLAEVNITWASELFGTAIDPTGQSAGSTLLPVQMAFPVSSGDLAHPSQAVTWFAASWLLGSTAPGFVSQCLVGPPGGVVTLVSGQSYDVWGKVIGSPEVPAIFAGVQSVY